MSDLSVVMAARAAIRGNVAVFYPCECDEHETGQEHFVDELVERLNLGDYESMRDNALGWQMRAYRAEALLAEVRSIAQHWRSDAPLMPQSLRQGAAGLLALLDGDASVGPLDEYRGQ